MQSCLLDLCVVTNPAEVIEPVSEDQGAAAYRALYINGHENGCVMERLTKMEERQDVTDDALKRIEDGIHRMPKTVLLGLSILLALLGIFQFLTPSIKKALNLNDAAYPAVSSQQTTENR